MTAATLLRLGDLVARVEARYGAVIRRTHQPVDGLEISGITHDSRAVRPGSLFVCVRGGNADGHMHAKSAIAAGAVGLVVDHRLSDVGEVPQIEVENTRDQMGRLAAAFYGFPGDHMVLVGVTGTNGKTTTAHTLESILRAAGMSVGVIGTLTQKRTTPEATDIQQRLAELRDVGCKIVVLEVTSHALDLQRVRGLQFSIAIFTNLSQDHLDFHGSIESYFRAKAKLFTSEYAKFAIVNADDRYGRLLFDGAEIPTEPVSIDNAKELVLGPHGSQFSLDGHQLTMPIAGAFNVMNAIEAVAAARRLGISWESIAEGIANTRVAGRFEPVVAGQSFAVYVDFAHTPDGLERVLGAARETVGTGRLISVFGCGGDRDRTKRPIMAEIGSRLSDVTILTADNPRSEDVNEILKDMLSGVDDKTNVYVQPDRRAAIESALAQAQAGDVVVIAGKGHEQGQESAGVITPFDDRDVARNYLLSVGPTP
jgi:UDP-N-acetylmuramoyl-L-alanyl-D-glutamate--2,6-diaminopimelate ligase